MTDGATNTPMPSSPKWQQKGRSSEGARKPPPQGRGLAIGGEEGRATFTQQMADGADGGTGLARSIGNDHVQTMQRQIGDELGH
jgi:hypothetical protein